jgi:hypothetical protein
VWTQALNVTSSKGAALPNGKVYYVTVVATNRAGPRLTANASSGAVLLDFTPPVQGIVFNT